MQTRLANNGMTYRLADLNCILYSSLYYLYSGSQSDPINLTDIWQNHVVNLTSPTVPLSALFQTPVTQETIDAVDNQYYWLFGSAQKGGLCFFRSGTSMTMGRVSFGQHNYDETSVDTSGNLYMYDELYGNGAKTNQSCFIIINASSTQGTLSLGGQHIVIHPTTPPTWTIADSIRACNTLPNYLLPIQSSWNYVGVDQPWGIGVNATNSDSWQPAGIPTFMVKSPWLQGNVPTLSRLTWWDGVEQIIEDPFDDVASDDSDGGGGGEIMDTVPIDFSPLPPDILSASGIIKMFHPSVSDMYNLTNWLYSRPDSVITNLKKIWTNPMESIISLSIVPFALTDGASESVKFCGIDTGLTFPTLANRYININCGTTTAPVKEEYNSFVSYGFFTKVKLCLPFIGIVDLNTDDIIGSTLNLKYNIDILTGSCVAELKCVKSRPDKKINIDAVLYQFKGNVIDQAPLSANNYQQLYSGILSSIQHVAMMQADPLGGATGLAGDLISPKVNVQRSGTITGNTGHLGKYKPYLIIERPPLNIPKNNGRFNGYISNKYVLLCNCTGFTVVSDGCMRMKETHATEEEIQMIKEQLEAGVIFPDAPRKYK